MKQLKDRIISAAILFSVILTGVLSDAAKAFLCTGLCRFDRRVDRRNFCFLIQKEASIFQAEDRFCNDPDPAAVR